MPSATINTTSNAATLVTAPGAGKYVRVLGYVVMCGGTANISFSSAGVALTGNMPCTQAAGAVAPQCDQGWFDLTANQALNIAQDNAQQLGGHVAYEIRT